MFYRNSAILILLAILFVTSACPTQKVKENEEPKAPLGEIPAQLLNYRFDPDVPAPSEENKEDNSQRNEKIQTTFDEKRPQDILDKTIVSPDNQRILVVYHKIGDLPTEFRLDMYDADAKLISKITHEEMAVHFADTIVWSPDSKNVAFVAMVRGGRTDYTPETDKSKDSNSNTSTEVDKTPAENSNSNTNTESNADSNANVETTNTDTNSDETVEQPKEVITFRTEQIYMSNADGKEVQPLTQSEGLIYFYFAWAPNSSALAALATPITEWRIRQQRMVSAGYLFVPQGRPRMIEKNGRERLLDDFPTYVHPVWSPDSAKIAVAYNKQIRIYDAIGARPTQAAIPLRNDLLLSSKNYDEKLKSIESTNTNTESNSENSETEKPESTPDENANSNANVAGNQPKSALPNPSMLVSFNPIINLEWMDGSMLYLQTGYVKDMQNETESVRSYLRWHRLILSSQVKNIQRTDIK